MPEPRPLPLLRPDGRDDRTGEEESRSAGGEPLRGRALDRPRVVEPGPAADAPTPDTDDGRVTRGTRGMAPAVPAPSSSLLSTIRVTGRRERLRGIDGRLDVSSSMLVTIKVHPQKVMRQGGRIEGRREMRRRGWTADRQGHRRQHWALVRVTRQARSNGAVDTGQVLG